MKRLMLAASLFVFGLMTSSTVHAQTLTVRGPVGGASFSVRPYYHAHGIRYTGGYYYPGRTHTHWEHRRWDPVYARYHYFDPYLRVYYYYCPSRLGYYPIDPIGPIVPVRPIVTVGPLLFP
ncbi:MAG: hypothetical protein EBV06_06935 [Planctomycetia bacterium]|nr:hypothetical protein [Planctomycetia bacterium]